jgi:hypothetical protein
MGRPSFSDAGSFSRGAVSVRHRAEEHGRPHRGRLYGFRWRDRLDCSSAAPGQAITPLDQAIGTADGTATTFPLLETYGGAYAPYQRSIGKSVSGSMRVAVAGSEVTEGTAFTCDTATGIVTFLAGHMPALGVAVTADFQFDALVRFDTDYLEVDLSVFAAGVVRKFHWWRSSHEGDPIRFAGQVAVRHHPAVPLLSHHAARRRGAGLHRPRRESSKATPSPVTRWVFTSIARPH